MASGSTTPRQWIVDGVLSFSAPVWRSMCASLKTLNPGMSIWQEETIPARFCVCLTGFTGLPLSKREIFSFIETDDIWAGFPTQTPPPESACSVPDRIQRKFKENHEYSLQTDMRAHVDRFRTAQLVIEMHLSCSAMRASLDFWKQYSFSFSK